MLKILFFFYLGMKSVTRTIGNSFTCVLRVMKHVTSGITDLDVRLHISRCSLTMEELCSLQLSWRSGVG